jgi:exopolysaccharide/PEP-CTERM locus tyrosine autokinase
MGKIFDALKKAASEQGKTGVSKAKSPLIPPREELPPVDREAIDSCRLQDTVQSSPTTTQRSFQWLPVDELLVTCCPDGNREFNFAAEQYKMLRSQLLFPVGRPVPRTIMVTSAVPGEGKSVVASNLAASIALCKKEHVLLLECDLRRPSLSGLFGFKSSRGLADYLMEEGDLSNLLRKTPVDKLTLLPAGSLTRNPYELLSSPKMFELLEEVSNRYPDRYIILDSTPVQVAAEITVLSKFVDGILMVVRYGKSSRKIIQESIQKVGKDKFLGVVFNCFEGKYSNEYYYKYYGESRKKIFRMFRKN